MIVLMDVTPYSPAQAFMFSYRSHILFLSGRTRNHAVGSCSHYSRAPCGRVDRNYPAFGGNANRKM